MTPGGYLAAAERRLGHLRLARGAAVVAAAALAITLVVGWAVMTLVPAAATVGWLRVLLYVGLSAAVAVLVWWPRTPERTALAVEQRVPAFQGRLVTWLDARRRGDDSALFALLGRQTAAIAAAHPLDREIPARQLAWPAGLAVLAAALLAALLAGSHPWQLAAQRLWVGNLFADAQPRIVVSPGDTVVRRGSDVVVSAEAHGFLPGSMELHAAFGASDWERAPMSGLDAEKYSFVFVGVGEEIEYYVSARGLTSSRHRIRVADLPTVTDVELTHHYPAWTGREPLRSRQGEVTALPGTRVDVRVRTDRPISEAVLVLNGEAHRLEANGAALEGRFEVTLPGSWHVAVPHEGDLARISDSYLVELAEDAPPEVAYTFSGHDRKATTIEEVVLGFEAEDDYRVEALALFYAVNGGDWVQVPLALDRSEHLLALESISVSDGAGSRGLRPGDVISLYGEARDHAQRTRTALYFVDVRPFDMRYRESQQMGDGAAGAEGGGFDIAERQRDILSATWNLINKRDGMEPKALRDQADVLAMLQRTLRDQVETLIARSQARGLRADEEVSQFLRELGRALSYMEPAAVKLTELALDEAVPPEQQALKHLVTAESSVRDVDVSLARNGRGTSGRSLGELIELEMDRERNRYEMPQQPGRGETAGDEHETDWKRLDELAARQERLARQQGQNPDSLPSRWEQARLERELAELKQEFEARSQSGGETSRSMQRAIADMTEAERQLEGAEADPNAARRAGEALRGAAEALERSSAQDLQERLTRANRRVANLEADQARVMEALDRLQQSALDRARSGERIGRSDYGMQTFGAVKRRMQDDVAELRGELAELSIAVSERDADSARFLDQAVRELDEVRVDERLAASAEAFEIGQPLYVIGSEALVQQALERLGRRLDQARDSITEAGAGDDGDPLQEVRTLRRQLQQARDDGTLSDEQVASVARSLARLSPDGDPRLDGPGDGVVRPLPSSDVYHIRGTDDANTDTLYRMTLERLDLVEALLESADAPPVRAQEPRDAARDSAAAARYFRELSTATLQEEEDDER